MEKKKIDTKNNPIIVGKYAFLKTVVYYVWYLIIYYKLFRSCWTCKACRELQMMSVYSSRSKAAAISKMDLVVSTVINYCKLLSQRAPS